MKVNERRKSKFSKKIVIHFILIYSLTLAHGITRKPNAGEKIIRIQAVTRFSNRLTKLPEESNYGKVKRLKEKRENSHVQVLLLKRRFLNL